MYIIVCYVNKDPTHLQGLDLGSDITSAVDYQVPSENGVESVDFSLCFGKLQKKWGIWDSWYLDIWYLVQNHWKLIDPKMLDLFYLINFEFIFYRPVHHWNPIYFVLRWLCRLSPQKTSAPKCLPPKIPLEKVKPWLWSSAKSTMFELSAQCIWGLYPVSGKSNLRAFRFLILKY